MKTKLLSLAAAGLMLLAGSALADAPLKSKLDLDMHQASAVADIQAEYRRTFSAKRQEFNRESRALRRARSANDVEAVARQELIVAALQQDLTAIRAAENAAIRAVLTPEQQSKFDAVLAERAAMVGSSRDSKVAKN
ncbi:MAG: Spy/CpxP family protein refolding chaperone [Pseudomonadota bacterium]